MKIEQKFNNFLRKKVFWFLGLPLTVLVLSSIMHKVASLEDFHVVCLNFLIGGPIFPAFSLVGLGFNLDKFPRVLPFIISIGVYTIFWLFIKNLNLLNKKVLFTASFFIIILIILGLRGCTIELSKPLHL